MLICKDYKFCYQHIPKTGGTFTKHFFSDFIKFNDLIYDKTIYGHQSYESLKNNHDYDLLISVRNPIDRIVSLYCDICHYESVTNFNVLENKSSKFYSSGYGDGRSDFGVSVISDRERFKKDCCKDNCIEYFIDHFYNTYCSKNIEKSIELCKGFGKKIYILKQECLVNDLFQFCYIKKIPIEKDAKDFLLNKIIRVSDSKIFLNNKRKLLSNKTLFKKIIDNEKFLSDFYGIQYNL